MSFSSEQQEYLKGFVAGVDARQPRPGGGSGGGAPVDALHQAQDATIAAGGKLTPEEQAKRERHPLDRWDELTARADSGAFPKGTDVLMTKYHGLFFVAPAQNSFMTRLRIPGGIMTSHQARGAADIAEELGGGYLDITTRANLQIREIAAAHGPEVVMRLGEIGMLPRGTGADNIRNITASPTVGIDATEWLDTRPQVRALHHHILTTRDLFGLPRKFNIALDGGGAVAVLEETNDISLRAARTPDGTLLYALGLGGITGHMDFARQTGVAVPPADVVRLCDAILRVFIAHGDRTDRKKARLKYLLDRWGHDKFLGEVEALFGCPLPRPEGLELAPSGSKHGHVGVHAQKQAGLSYVGVVTPLGRLTVAQMRGLAALAEKHGAGEIRLTVWQSLIINDVADVAPLLDGIAALGLSHEASHLRGGLVACTGSAGCKFAASNTKRHAAEIAAWLDARITLPAPINIHLTGCHHSCAQHYVADIGLLGAKVERGEEEVEGYDLHVGGGAGPEQKIGRLIRPRVAADELAPLLLNLFEAWLREAPGDSFQRFCEAHDDAALNERLDMAEVDA